MQCLLHHPVLLNVQVEDCLLEVAHSSMDQLGAATASSRGEVVALHQGSAET